MARILITGGSGFLGTNLVQHFIERGDEVVNVDILSPRNQDHLRYWKSCDLTDAIGIRNAIDQADPHLILHMGARTDLMGRSIEDYSANTEGVSNLIDAVEGREGLQRIIFASSRLVCRIGYQPTGEADYCPTTAYGESKVEGELIVRNAARRIPCPWLIVRPTSIWGPWFDVPYKTFFRSVARGVYLHPGETKIAKSFGFVGNTVYEIDRLLQATPSVISGKTVFLADYPPIDVLEMAELIRDALDAPRIHKVDVRVLRALAAVGDSAQKVGWRNPPLTSFRLDNLMTDMVYDLEQLEEWVGELPYSLSEGVDITARWLKAHG